MRRHRLPTLLLAVMPLACASDDGSDAADTTGDTGAETTSMTSTTAASTTASTSTAGTATGDPTNASADASTANDASSDDGGSSSGGAATSCADYLFCEDFEDGNPGETPPGWTEHFGWDQSGSRAQLSSEQHHGGAQSLKSAVGTNGQFRVEHDLAMLGDAVSHHWGRIFYKVKTPIALDGMYVHNTFVAFGRPEASNGAESRLVDTVVAPDGTHQFLFNVPDDTCCTSSSYDFTYDDQWHCAEWYVDGATQSYQFFYDGAEVTDLAFSGVADAYIADFTSIIVGWIDYQSPSTPNEGWFDDLAIDDERIGCD